MLSIFAVTHSQRASNSRPRSRSINKSILPALLMLAVAIGQQCALAADKSKLLAVAAAKTNTTLSFRLHLVSTTKYTFNNAGEILDHKLERLTGKSGNYRIDEEVVDDSGLISIRLSYSGKTILSKHLPRWQGLTEDSFNIIDPLTNEACNKAPVFRDINADGFAELILELDNGSAHGTVDQTIYKIQPGTGQLPQLVHAALQSPAFLDKDHKGVYSLSVDDQTFAYWKGSAYCEYSPTGVVLSLKDGKWLPNAALMTEAEPTKAVFEKQLQELNAKLEPFDKVSQSKTRAMTPLVWNAMKEYVYTGNASSARALRDRLYPDGTTLVVAPNSPDDMKAPKAEDKLSRAQFWKDFCDTVKHSRYSKTLYAMDTHKVLQ